MTSAQDSLATATKMFNEAFDQVVKDRQELDEEKKKWEEEKAVMHKKFIFSGPKIIVDVGGIHYSTSRSTLTKYPESMLGIMFSGRHDLETMQCKDGSFFIDRDGTHFRYILNYLRDGEEVAESFPKSPDVLLELNREAKFYQLDGLTSLLKWSLVCATIESDAVNRNQITSLFSSSSGTYNNYSTDYGVTERSFRINYYSQNNIEFMHKNMKKLSFKNMSFDHPVSFINCDLTNATFQNTAFQSDAIFEDCILDNTSFTTVRGLVSNSHKVSFTGSKIDKTNFEPDLKSSLKSKGKIP